jgi:branched-chain amino acid aminotransferase
LWLFFNRDCCRELRQYRAIAENQFKVCETIIDLNESYQALVRKKKAA